MTRRYLFWLYISIAITLIGEMKAEEKNTHIVIETILGDIEIKLYNETPQHRDNIIRLIEQGAYNDQKFHRVIKDFMIQGGETSTQSRIVNDGDSALYDYTVPAEIVYPTYFHKKGAFAAARLADNINPEKASSPSQFYIVTGALFNDQALDLLEKQRIEKLKQTIFSELNTNSKDLIKELYRSGEKEKLTQLRDSLVAQATDLAVERNNEALFSKEQREAYTTIGGAPHLDGSYTVFGEVVKGMDIVDEIQQTPTTASDKPVADVFFKVFLKKE